MKPTQTKTQAVSKPAPVAKVADAPVVAVPKSDAPRVCIRAVNGKMVDPYTNLIYTQAPLVLVGEITEGSWLDSQLKAGKLEKC